MANIPGKFCAFYSILICDVQNIPTVVTKEGFLFDKEVILKYIISKKNEYNRKLKEYERQKTGDLKELEEIAAAQNKIKLDKFMKTEKNIKDASGKSGLRDILTEDSRVYVHSRLSRCQWQQIDLQHVSGKGQSSSKLLGAIKHSGRKQSQSAKARQSHLLPNHRKTSENERSHRC